MQESYSKLQENVVTSRKMYSSAGIFPTSKLQEFVVICRKNTKNPISPKMQKLRPPTNGRLRLNSYA